MILIRRLSTIATYMGNFASTSIAATIPVPVKVPVQVRPEVYDQEEQVLKYSGLEINKELFVYDVPIQMKGKEYKIHTYRCGDENKEDLVLLHGYGGSSVLYYPMLKELSKRYRVFCIDFVGMGLSSKEKFECQSTEETLDLLVGSIEKWRQEVGIDKFHLVGHSFGGYVSGQYTLQNEERVKKLTLLSPVGITKRVNEPTIEEFKSKLGFFQGILYGWLLRSWENKITPGTFIKNHPWLGKMIIGRYSERVFKLQSAEGEALRDFLLNMHKLPEGAEQAIHYILKPPFASAYMPLEEAIPQKLKVPVDCYYGEFDYMDLTGAKRIYEMQMKKNFTLKILPSAAHQLTMQNPKVLAQEIVLGE